MKIEQERLDDFQARMNEWVSKQGLLFQLRYAGNVQGAKSSFFHTLGSLFLRLVLVLILVAFGFAWYLVKRVETAGFQTKVEESLVQGFRADDLELGGVSRKRGMLKLGIVNMIGGDKSAFEDLELRGVQILMGLTDGLLKPWSSDTIEISSLKGYVKGGASSNESAAESFNSLFWSSENLKIRAIKVGDVNLKWGYSESNRGHVIGSKLVATRKGESWNLVLTGGTFSQNWLRDLALERMEIELNPDGFFIHEARMKKNGGDISFTLKKVGGGMSPEFEGKGAISGVPVSSFIGSDYNSLIGGLFSADFEFSGSTNTQQGFKFVVDAVLGEEDKIEALDGISLLRALSTADYQRIYRKVRFTEGGFRLTVEPGKLMVEDIALVASRLMRLEGGFTMRPPREDELPKDLVVAEKDRLTRFADVDQTTSESLFIFSLRQSGDDAEFERESGELLFGEREGLAPEEEIKSDARTRELQRVYLDGAVRVGILPSIFERHPELAEEFPVDEATELRWIDLVWDAESPFTIGDKVADKIFELSAAVTRENR